MAVDFFLIVNEIVKHYVWAIIVFLLDMNYMSWLILIAVILNIKAD